MVKAVCRAGQCPCSVQSGLCNLGWCYENGRGVSQNYSEAAKWYSKSAEQGNAGAQNNLGKCYYNGIGVVKNRTEAVKWLKLAAAQGNEMAKKNMSIINSSGSGDGSFLEELTENVLSNLLSELL